jgi:hypothetical protein
MPPPSLEIELEVRQARVMSIDRRHPVSHQIEP